MVPSFAEEDPAAKAKTPSTGAHTQENQNDSTEA